MFDMLLTFVGLFSLNLENFCQLFLKNLILSLFSGFQICIRPFDAGWFTYNQVSFYFFLSLISFCFMWINYIVCFNVHFFFSSVVCNLSLSLYFGFF